jgi:anti-anti-sigma factor
MEHLDSKIEKEGEVTIVSFGLDAVTAEENEELKRTFLDLLEGGARKIILDLSGTFFISSLTIASLVYIFKKTKDAGGSFVLCGVKDKVKEVLEITNLNKVFEIVDDRKKAMKAVAPKN